MIKTIASSYKSITNKMEANVDGCVHGFHVYQDIWTPIIVKVLACWREMTNIEDRYAIAINKMEEVVGHVPCKISFLCAAFILPYHVYNHAKNFVRIIRRINIWLWKSRRKISGRKHSRFLTDSRNPRKFSSVDDSQYTVSSLHIKANSRSMVAKRSQPPRQLHIVPLTWPHTIIRQLPSQIGGHQCGKLIIWWPPAYIYGDYLLRKMAAMSVRYLCG